MKPFLPFLILALATLGVARAAYSLWRKGEFIPVLIRTLVRRVCLISGIIIVALVALYEFGGVSLSAPPTVDVKVCSNNVDIVIAARTQIGVTTNYVADYRKIDYPNGDIPRGEGVCSDVVVRALRDARKIDLQELMHLDMSANFSKYPRKRK